MAATLVGLLVAELASSMVASKADETVVSLDEWTAAWRVASMVLRLVDKLAEMMAVWKVV